MGGSWKTAGGGGVTALLAATVAFAPDLAAQQSTALPDSSHQRWEGVLEQRTLGDDSVLSVYTARTAAFDTADVVLQIGFVPRFECRPLVGIRFGGRMASVVEAFLEDGDRVSLDVDGEKLEWPLLVDADGVATSLWLDGELARREDVRKRLDAGSRASLVLPNAVSVGFSLLGSRRSVAGAEAACRAHEPPPWNG